MSVEEVRVENEKAAETLLAGQYDLLRNPNPQANELAQNLISNSKVCYGQAPAKGYTNYAQIDPDKGEAIIRVHSGMVGLQAPTAYSVMLDEFSWILEPLNPGKNDSSFALKVDTIRKLPNGDMVLFASEDEGLVHQWSFRCGDPEKGSSEWRHIAAGVAETISR